jgi:hypothetical protein
MRLRLTRTQIGSSDWFERRFQRLVRNRPWRPAWFARTNLRESSCVLASYHRRRQYFVFAVGSRRRRIQIGHFEETLENLYCLRCNRELEPGNKSVAVYMFAQTVGVRPRQKSSSQRICFCPQCSVSLAMGPAPEGALNIAAWNMIRDLVGADPALNQAAWESLRGFAGLLPATGSDDGSRRASGGGYFEF